MKSILRSLAELAEISLDEDINIKDEKELTTRVLSSGNLGLGEAYMEGLWEEVTPLDELAFRVSRTRVKEKLYTASWWLTLRLFWTWLYNLVFPPSPGDTKKMAQTHYDLSNFLYSEMLGPTMQYSCALFEQSRLNEKTFDLDQAQKNKMRLIGEKLKLEAGMKVLDVGCGWAGLSRFLVEEYKVEVVGLTVSREQYDYCCQLKVPGLSFVLSDYRNYQPAFFFQRIVSVGMFEHVTPALHGVFFQKMTSLLEEGGLFLLHTIASISSQQTCDPWIVKYIFPSSCLPSLTQISRSSEDKLIIEDVENLSTNYDKTLMAWEKNFRSSLSKINAQRFRQGNPPLEEKFIRMWRYYLLTCAGCFRARRLNLYQVLLSKKPLRYYQRV